MITNNLGLFRDAEDNTYEIIEKVKQTVHQPLKGFPGTHDGFKSYETSCRIPVNVKDGVFVTWDGVVLTPVD
jgi:hypothetical protein